MKTIIRDDVLQSDTVAIADDKGNKVTYRELTKKAQELSEHIEERSLIFVLCDRQMETLEFIYELLYLNRVPLLLPADMNMEHLPELLPEMLPEMLRELIEIYRPQYIYARNIFENYGPAVQFESHVLLSTGFERYMLHPDLALLLSTSGTTGSAKQVKLSYENIYSAAEAACSHMDIQAGQKGLCLSPLNHILGIIFCVWHWHCGATLMTTEAMGISRQFNEFYIKEKINNFAATPYIFQMLRKVGFWDGTKEEYLHRALAAGEKMPEEEYKSLHAIIRDKLWIAYGQTESTGFISAINFQKKYEDMLSVGKAFNHVEIVPDGGKGEMFTGGKLSTSGEMFTSGEMSTSGKLSTSGELCINSKSVCMGYAVNAEQLSDGDVNNGLLHTGDAVYIDDDGYIFLRGRLTRYAKILGKRVSLDDVEMYLNNKYKNAEFACTGTDNAISVFYAKAESNLNEEIPALLDRSMKIPKKFISCLYMERIPRTGAGKIAYAALEQL